MFTYQVHTIESAPGKSKPALEQLERVFGFVPNIAGAIANSPVLANHAQRPAQHAASDVRSRRHASIY
jgi:hypothetical protein